AATAATLSLALGAAVPAAALGGAPAPTVHSVLRATRAHRSGSAHATVVIANFTFHPMRLVVAPGERIVVQNKDAVVHTLTATDGRFSTGDIPAHGTRAIRAPRAKGTYHYLCAIHQFMTGSIVVR
ncbi:MAG TPA: cupredoxin domain-containing protein, partial [Acidimicrobiales bacterium]|nr:cupredoxin domain-containing protein [Acidimicrobiales bacterium]